MIFTPNPTPAKCPSCDGTGVDLYDGTTHDCPVCHGTGTYYGDTLEEGADALEALRDIKLWSDRAQKLEHASPWDMREALDAIHAIIVKVFV